jgi:hypothetical protein
MFLAISNPPAVNLSQSFPLGGFGSTGFFGLLKLILVGLLGLVFLPFLVSGRFCTGFVRFVFDF